MELGTSTRNSTPSSNNSRNNSNKEDVVVSENKFDRIKQRSSNGAKRASSPNFTPSISRPAALLKSHLKYESEGEYDSSNASYKPIPPTATSDFTYETASPQSMIRLNVNITASVPTSTTFASTGSTLKRRADPECDNAPSSKRSGTESVEQQDEGLELATTQSHTVLEARRSSPQAKAPGTPPLDNPSHKVQESSSNLLSSESCEISLTSPDSEDRSSEDAAFIDKVKGTLETQSKRKTNNVGRRQARRILELLKLAKPAQDDGEAVFLAGQGAKALLEANVFFPGPIFTSGQQTLALQTITQFLDEHYDNNAQVWIQDPDHKLPSNRPATRSITMGKLKEHFDKDRVSAPYNCLELAAHVEDGIRPTFLNTEDCRLLTKLKHPGADDKVSRRGYEAGWKEVEKWALLAKAGALTEPHQDSHGYGTYITANQGIFGFGWLSNPSPAQRAAWCTSPTTFTAGEWRYAVLRPGETVYFPGGTVHFVFRSTSDGDTLAFGGHVLRSSQIVNWVKCLLEEKNSQSQATNEELTVSAPAYLERVEKYVKQARDQGASAWKWGGEGSIEEFLQLKKQFMERDSASDAGDMAEEGDGDNVKVATRSPIVQSG